MQGRIAPDVGQLLLPLLRLPLLQVVRDMARQPVLVRAVDLRLDGEVLLLQPHHRATATAQVSRAGAATRGSARTICLSSSLTWSSASRSRTRSPSGPPRPSARARTTSRSSTARLVAEPLVLDAVHNGQALAPVDRLGHQLDELLRIAEEVVQPLAPDQSRPILLPSCGTSSPRPRAHRPEAYPRMVQRHDSRVRAQRHHRINRGGPSGGKVRCQ